MDLASTTRAENRTSRKGIVVKSYVTPNSPCKVMGDTRPDLYSDSSIHAFKEGKHKKCRSDFHNDARTPTSAASSPRLPPTSEVQGNESGRIRSAITKGNKFHDTLVS